MSLLRGQKYLHSDQDMVACIGFGGPVNSYLACISEHDAVSVADFANLKKCERNRVLFVLATYVRLRSNIQVGNFVCVIGIGALGYLIVQTR